MHKTERMKWYTSFGVILIALIVVLAALHQWKTAIIIIAILAMIAIYDIFQKKHSILRNFPVLGHIRFILEFFRPEIQQYFVASDLSERPFDRQTRTLIYQRAKGIEDTLPFGTDRDIEDIGYEWILHSLAPVHFEDVNPRISIGNFQCKKPYSASRLNISAMSYGALSKNAVIALNKAARMGGFYQNTGEGGLTEYHLQEGGDIVLQVGTGYFGFRTHEGKFDEDKFRTKVTENDAVKMIEIKLSQGAKPSHGGVLPKEKVTPEIARIRDVLMGVDVLSPPTHSTFDNPIGLCRFVARLRELSNGKPVGFKLCIGRRTEFMAICKAIRETEIYPDFITIDGAEGGTGAAPAEYTNYVGVPLEDALAFVHNALVGAGIKEHIKIICSGKNATGFDMVRNLALGADAINSARAMMFSIGCIQSKQCNKNTCPTGVATQNPRLYKALDINDKSLRASRYHAATIKSFCEIIGAMGIKNPNHLSANQIMRRVDINHIKSLEEIYHFVSNGDFLNDETLPGAYAQYWKNAKADTFCCEGM